MSPIIQPAHVSTFRSTMLHLISSLRARIPFLRFFHLSALISYFCSTINVISLFFVFSFFLSCTIAEQIFASAFHFAFASILHSVQCAASAFIFSSLFFIIAAAAVFVFFFSFSLTQWHISTDVVVFECSSSFSFQVFVFSCVVSFLSLLCLMHVGKSPSTFFELVPAAYFTCASVASLIFLCRCVHLTTRSLSFISASLSRLSTTHSRCDEFFDCHCSI